MDALYASPFARARATVAPLALSRSGLVVTSSCTAAKRGPTACMQGDSIVLSHACTRPGMAQLTIRKLDDDLVRRLKLRAAQNNRSAEAEVRAILEGTLKGPSRAADSIAEA